MKRLNVTLQYSVIGTSQISVPKELTIEEAIEYAKKNIHEIELPSNPSYIIGSNEIDEENCNFDDEDDSDGNDI